MTDGAVVLWVVATLLATWLGVSWFFERMLYT